MLPLAYHSSSPVALLGMPIQSWSRGPTLLLATGNVDLGGLPPSGMGLAPKRLVVFSDNNRRGVKRRRSHES